MSWLRVAMGPKLLMMQKTSGREISNSVGKGKDFRVTVGCGLCMGED